MRDRENLIARIRHLRRIKSDSEPRSTGAGGASPPGSPQGVQPPGSEAEGVQPPGSEAERGRRLDQLEVRIGHLEKLVEGFQDSVHSETERQGKLIAELQAQIHPEAMSAALSKDARARGL
jgi:hypothetical protein